MSICRVIAAYSGMLSSKVTAVELDINNPANLPFREQRSLAELLAYHGDVSVGWISGISVYHAGGITQYPLNYLASYTTDIMPGNGIESIVLGQDGKTYINTSGSTGGVTLAEVRSDLYTSGYVRNVDLVGSGYVRSINGLANTPTIRAGSGIQSVGVQGTEIYINTSGGSYTRYTTVNLPWNATSLQNASGLAYPIGPGEVICGEANLFFTVATAATGMAFALNGPASPDTVQMSMIIPTTATAVQFGSASAYETKVIGTAGLVTANVAQMKFFVINGPNAGTLQIRICSEGTTVVTLLKGSWAKFTRV